MALEPADRELLVAGITSAITTTVRGPATDEALADLGWLDLLAAHPHEAVELVFGTAGRVGAVPWVLDDVVAHELGAPTPTAVVLPAAESWTPPGLVSGGRIDVDGLSLGRHAIADDVVVPLAEGWVRVPVAGVTITPIAGADPELGLARVTATSLRVDGLERSAGGPWERAVSSARVAIGWQLVGIAEAMLESARAHALDRVQFGRPIASFQAVRHKLAETLVAVEAGRESLRAAAVDPRPVVALAAAIVAGRAARVAGRHAQQVLAGIGFTTEHDFQAMLKQSMVLDTLFGSTPRLSAELGRLVRHGGDLPVDLAL